MYCSLQSLFNIIFILNVDCNTLPKSIDIDKEIINIIILCNITLICVTLVLGFKSIDNSLSLDNFYLRLDLWYVKKRFFLLFEYFKMTNINIFTYFIISKKN